MGHCDNVKIFAYYKKEIHELDVTETKTMYISKDGNSPLAFGCKSRFKKSDEWSTTEMGTVLREIKNKLSLRSSLEEKIHDINSELSILKKLGRSYCGEETI